MIQTSIPYNTKFLGENEEGNLKIENSLLSSFVRSLIISILTIFTSYIPLSAIFINKKIKKNLFIQF